MKTTRQDINPTKVKLTITLDASELEAAQQVSLTKLAETVKVDGFRKGSVPASVAKKHVDPVALAEETADNAVSKAVAEAFTSEEIQALERPQVEIVKFEPGKSLEFSAEAEIIPKVKLGDYKNLKAPKQDKIVVTKDQVDEVVGRIREQMASKEEVTRAAKDGDEAVIDFVGKKDGVAFDGGTGSDHALTLGSNSFIPGFEEAVVGHKTGESFTIPLSFPSDYHVADLAGQKVEFDVTIKKLNEVVLPELNDELAAKAGSFSSAKELTDDIERELKARAEQEQQDKLRDDLVTQLIEKSDVPVPAVLVDDQVRSIEQDMTQNLMYQGLTFDAWLESKGYQTKDEWIDKEAKKLAEQRVQAGLILSELSKDAKIEATKEELAERIGTMQQQYANNPEMAQRFNEPEVQRDIANRLLTEKTIDTLVELNTK